MLWPFMSLKFIYMQEISATFVGEIIMCVLLIFMFTTVFAMIILYISTLHVRIKAFNVENIKLLDGMHESLLILSKTNNRVMFCNKPS